MVGGIARTEIHDGYRFDIGGHRFFTKVSEVESFWREILGPDFIKVPRLSRIYYNNRFFSYPLEPFNALRNVGLIESTRIMMSYLKWRLRPGPVEENFEQWVTNRFGRRLYEKFFKTYTEKVWGIPCTQIRADWAAQRIKGISLMSAVLNALTRSNNSKQSTLIREFDYPRLGPGMMWEKCRDAVVEAGGDVRMETEVVGLERDGMRVTAALVRQGDEIVRLTGDNFLSTAPLNELIEMFDPSPPPPVRKAAAGLAYRDFLIVCLIVRGRDSFPDNWIYIHTPGMRVGRIQNFRNWSPEMVPDSEMSSVGMEYFCNEGDDLWEMDNPDLIALASRELEQLGLASAGSVQDGHVIRQQKAYPVYDAEYRGHLDVIRGWLTGLSNFQTIGRNGMHRYNNQDHSMLTAMLAVKNVMGEGSYDLWDVNTERSYHEDFTTEEKKGQQAVPKAEGTSFQFRFGQSNAEDSDRDVTVISRD